MIFDREGALSRAHYTQAYTMLALILWANIFSWLAWFVWHEHRNAAVALELIGWPGILAILIWVQWQENKSGNLSRNWKRASREAGTDEVDACDRPTSYPYLRSARTDFGTYLLRRHRRRKPGVSLGSPCVFSGRTSMVRDPSRIFRVKMARAIAVIRSPKLLLSGN
jgi:hypothetical protein